MKQRNVLITGAAGFIGSHLLSHCLHAGCHVVGVDNFLTGRQENIDAVLSESASFSSQFELRRDDIRDASAMVSAARGAEVIFHEAAIGSVPWSIRDPMLAHETNLTGFLNILSAARENGIRRVVYASSSAVYGDAGGIPAVEGAEGTPLSTYAASKFAQEIYAGAWAKCYGLEIIGLRYFNVFGPRQDPCGAYAAVIPKWMAAMKEGRDCVIFGDGSATRDYCHVSNIVRANDLAASVQLETSDGGTAQAVNIGCGAETSLLELHAIMASCYEKKFGIKPNPPKFEPARFGDIERSCADISRARALLKFEPVTTAAGGMASLFDI